jgi:hypothetical protein
MARATSIRGLKIEEIIPAMCGGGLHPEVEELAA